MTQVPIRFEPATDGDVQAIHALLAGYQLPTADLTHAPPWLVVARKGSAVVGVGGLETFGSVGLIRSVAVEQRLRGTGLGRSLVARLESRARDLGLAELLLLTETAKTFFGQLGYGAISRNDAPPTVQDSAEFRSLCPQSASCLAKRLANP